MTDIAERPPRIVHEGKTFERWILQEDIETRTDKIAQHIAACYEGRNVRMTQILRGAKEFGDLLLSRLAIYKDPNTIDTDTIQVKSYLGTESRELHWLKRPDKPIDGDTNIILVEDIADTARTLTTVERELRALGPATLATAVMLDRPEARADGHSEYSPHIVGFEISKPEAWAIGVGLDLDGIYRDLPDIYGRVVEGQSPPPYTTPDFPSFAELWETTAAA